MFIWAQWKKKRPSTAMKKKRIEQKKASERREREKNCEENWKLRRKKMCVAWQSRVHNWLLFRFKFIPTLPLFKPRNDPRHMVAHHRTRCSRSLDDKQEKSCAYRIVCMRMFFFLNWNHRHLFRQLLFEIRIEFMSEAMIFGRLLRYILKLNFNFAHNKNNCSILYLFMRRTRLFYRRLCR